MNKQYIQALNCWSSSVLILFWLVRPGTPFFSPGFLRAPLRNLLGILIYHLLCIYCANIVGHDYACILAYLVMYFLSQPCFDMYYGSNH